MTHCYHGSQALAAYLAWRDIVASRLSIHCFDGMASCARVQRSSDACKLAASYGVWRWRGIIVLTPIKLGVVIVECGMGGEYDEMVNKSWRGNGMIECLEILY